MTRHRDDGLPYYMTVNVNCRITEHLYRDIKVLLMDSNGYMPPRGWSRVIEEGMRLWLKDKQNNPAFKAHLEAEKATLLSLVAGRVSK